MSTQSANADAAGSLWTGTISEAPASSSERLNELLRQYWASLAEADRHLSALDSRACSLAGEIDNYDSMVILTGSSEKP